MKKSVYWVVIIALGVFIGFTAFDRFKAFQADSADEQSPPRVQAGSDDEAAQPLGVKIPAQTGKGDPSRKNKVSATVCTVDPETDKCTCVHRETGEIIPKPHYDCFLRASKN